MASSTWVDASVTALGPLRVRIDGDASAVPFEPDSLIDPVALAVGDRVRCELAQGRVIVHGRARGLKLASAATTIVGAATDQAVTPAGLKAAALDRIAAIEALPPTRGVVPSSVVVGSGSASVAADGTVSFAGCSSISLNGVFNGAGADAYLIYIRYTPAASGVGNFRLRAAGVDATASNYERGYVYGVGTSVTGADTGGQDRWFFGTTGTDITQGSVELTSPGRAEPTVGFIKWGIVSGGSVLIAGAGHSPSIAYDGFTFLMSASTATGWMKVVKLA